MRAARHRRGLLLARRHELAAADRDLFSRGACDLHRRFLRVDLLDQRRDVRPGDFVRGSRGIQLLLRPDAVLDHPLRAIERDARVLELGVLGGTLRLGRSEVRLSLRNLVVHLPFLQAHCGLAFGHL